MIQKTRTMGAPRSGNDSPGRVRCPSCQLRFCNNRARSSTTHKASQLSSVSETGSPGSVHYLKCFSGAGAGGGRGGRRKSAAASEGPAAGRTAAAKEGKETSEHEPEEYTASGRRKRKDAGQQGARGASRGWSEEEEKLFIEVACCGPHVLAH